MNILPRDRKIAIIAALTEGVGIRATARLTGANRETVGKLALDVGRGCAKLHDRRMVGIRVARLELDEVWGFVGKKQKRVKPHEAFAKGDQYVFVALAAGLGWKPASTWQRVLAGFRRYLATENDRPPRLRNLRARGPVPLAIIADENAKWPNGAHAIRPVQAQLAAPRRCSMTAVHRAMG
jgi:hypothetical protein